MPSPLAPEDAPLGDVGTAMLLVDAQLRRVRAGAPPREIDDRALRAFDARGARDVLDGACTLIFVFVQWLRHAHGSGRQGVLAEVVPPVVRALRALPGSVRAEGVPTMAAMMTAAALDQSPTLWRRHYGPWTAEEITALEITAFLLADRVNALAGDAEAATRLVTELLTERPVGP
ncbi:hypothetical protein [Actinomadura parmotrematis]|uniref:Uncharacterized protein n=1 Tax=Actinomadura parmotrematis TaxID=2864039 RepID=A0ABS7FWG6_9ACTN|nr:hypothetical protein [Actinomadura parmotrematis]MBW8484762.1 hypothetical protein [Actinomadura parmotrematis]